jgi:hypothetical protein
MASQDWQSHQIQSGPRKGQSVFKNRITGEIRDTAPSDRGEGQEEPQGGKNRKQEPDRLSVEGIAKDAKLGVSQVKELATSILEEAEEELAEEWDGTIDADEVEADSSWYEKDYATWNHYNGGELQENTIQIDHGTFTPPNGEDPIDVYRWVNVDHDDDETEAGEWTTDEDEAKRDGRKYANSQNEEPPDPTDGDIDDDVSGQSWEYRDYIADFRDQDGDEAEVRLEYGKFEFAGIQHTCWRWTTENFDDGDWTLNRRRAIRDGENWARENNHEPEEDEEEEGNPHDVTDEDLEIEETAPPPKKEASTVKLGKSNAQVILTNVDQDQVNKMLKNLLGKEGSEAHQELASVVGAPDNATVKITYVGKQNTVFSDDVIHRDAQGVRVQIDHPFFSRISRFIGVRKDGSKFIRNEVVETKSAYKEQAKKEGTMLTMFSKQVENAAENGFVHIDTHAAGDSSAGSMNGYYTWPRFGYNESLNSIRVYNPSLADSIEEEFPEAKSIRDVMATKEGRDWWKENGSDLYHARFDLREDSWSRYIMDEYQAEREKQRGG